MTQTIAILCGGRGGEHQVSLRSALGIYAALDRSRYSPILAALDRHGSWRAGSPDGLLLYPDDPARIAINPQAPRVVLDGEAGRGRLLNRQGYTLLTEVDVFFPIIHGTGGEDGALQGWLRFLGAPFVGPDVLGSALGMDKEVAKRLLHGAGVPVARWKTLRRPDQGPDMFDAVREEFGLPVYVKPASQGSSVGVSRADNRNSFGLAVEEAFRHDTKVLVEEAVSGREIECSVLGGAGAGADPSGLGLAVPGKKGTAQTQASVAGEIIPRHGFYTYEAKYLDADGASLVVPARLPPGVLERVQAMAVEVFETLECYGMARVDFFLKPDGGLVVNEINTLPGFTPISMYPKLWEAAGLSYSGLLTRLIGLAVLRHEKLENIVAGDGL
ncbi:MAG: D-alanine--D-alanine ligase [Deltaproteobacteria bacterium]|nr:D-alanine--D-alanine ligase [Deltaproteobacteria bacterium]